jgi:uncharacterized protein (TIGR02246 family)
MSDELEERLRRLEDLQEIHQLFVDYGHHLDAGDLDAYADLFADDGELLLGPVARASGRDEIKAVMAKALAGSSDNSFHVISSPRVSLDGDTATSEVMWTVVERGDDGKPYLGMIGRHVDDLVRERGRWRFGRRKGYVDIPSVVR